MIWGVDDRFEVMLLRWRLVVVWIVWFVGVSVDWKLDDIGFLLVPTLVLWA